MKTELPSRPGCAAQPSDSAGSMRARARRSRTDPRPRARLSQEVALFLFVLALAVAFGFYQSIFWSGVNLQNVSRQGAVLAMVAVG